ncbi:MAG TPA: LysR substrate-binding domain-containing protein [Rhodoglobus sp.]|nr:LysR substrate-binding domain-containing protein [Rhodoglobus sp.]
MSAPLVVAFVTGVTPGKWARAWEQRRPRHPLRLVPTEQDAALAALDADEAAAAFVRLPVDTERLHAIPLYEERPVVVAPKDHPVAAFDELTEGDLAGETVLQGAWDEVIALAAANVGVAIVPQSVARAHSRRDVVARPIEGPAPTSVALVWRRDRPSEAIDAFIGVVRGRTANSSRG